MGKSGKSTKARKRTELALKRKRMLNKLYKEEHIHRGDIKLVMSKKLDEAMVLLREMFKQAGL